MDVFNAVLEEELQKSWKWVGLENSFVTSSVGYVRPTAEKKVDKNNIKKQNS